MHALKKKSKYRDPFFFGEPIQNGTFRGFPYIRPCEASPEFSEISSNPKENSEKSKLHKTQHANKLQAGILLANCFLLTFSVPTLIFYT